MWEELPHSTVVGIDAAVILSGIVYFLSGLASCYSALVHQPQENVSETV